MNTDIYNNCNLRSVALDQYAVQLDHIPSIVRGMPLEETSIGVLALGYINEARTFTKQQLAGFEVPRRAIFVAEADIGTTGSAKIKSAEVRKLAVERMAGS